MGADNGTKYSILKNYHYVLMTGEDELSLARLVVQLWIFEVWFNSNWFVAIQRISLTCGYSSA